MHKSKENPNGTFSIGKTWNLDDLTAIESFTGPPATPQNREWAGDTGFTVTLGKPYFWNAQSDKEKKFFIASLLKIYGKYTGGRAPELSGFDSRELEQVTGGGRRPPPAQRPPMSESLQASSRHMDQQPTQPIPSRSIMSDQGAASTSNLSVASAGSGYPQSTSSPAARRAPFLPNGGASPSGSMDSSLSQNQAALRALSGANNKSQESVAASSFANRSDDASSLPPRSRNGMAGGPGSFGGGGSRYDTPDSMPPSSPQPPLQPQDERPPERRRPPMDPLRPQGLADRDLVPAPLMSPGMRREPVAPPPRSMDRMSPRKPSGSQFGDSGSFKDRPITPGSFKDRPVTPAAEMTPPLAAPPMSDNTGDGSTPRHGSFSTMSSAAAAASTAGPEPPAEVSPITPTAADQEEEARPGLGPMIKSKKSRGEIAGAFWKAASAANAFKPRPGGAGDRLRLAAQSKPAEDSSDGITGVFQPPPKPKAEEPEKPAEDPAERANPEVPSVKVTLPNSSRPSSLQQINTKVEPQTSQPEEKRSQEIVKDEEIRKSIISGNDAKYLSALGVDPSILDNRSTDFTKWLDFFGWVPGEKMRSRHMDEMKIDIDREINKAQAGGWLSRFREEDDRVDAIKRGIDVGIAECEELDNLLTLYSVELSVGLSTSNIRCRGS